MAYVYAIINLINNKRYIGSTINPKRRWQTHKTSLRGKRHCNAKLQNAWNKYGEKSFRFDIVEIVDENLLLGREQYWLDFYQSYKSKIGYNVADKVLAWRKGKKTSPETIAKISAALRGCRHPNWGKKMTREWVRNMKRAVTGIPKPTSGKRKMFRLLSPTGEVVVSFGIREFCRLHNLTSSLLSMVINGKLDQTKGWRLAAQDNQLCA